MTQMIADRRESPDLLEGATVGFSRPLRPHLRTSASSAEKTSAVSNCWEPIRDHLQCAHRRQHRAPVDARLALFADGGEELPVLLADGVRLRRGENLSLLPDEATVLEADGR